MMYEEYLSAIIILTVLMHILDDYVLQGVCLSNLKQKSYWKENLRMYRNDYKVALIVHGMSWSSLVMLPMLVLMQMQVTGIFIIVWLAMGLVHAFIDDLKANLKVINLVTDQTLHMIQIAVVIILFWQGLLT